MEYIEHAITDVVKMCFKEAGFRQVSMEEDIQYGFTFNFCPGLRLVLTFNILFNVVLLREAIFAKLERILTTFKGCLETHVRIS